MDLFVANSAASNNINGQAQAQQRQGNSSIMAEFMSVSATNNFESSRQLRRLGRQVLGDSEARQELRHIKRRKRESAEFGTRKSGANGQLVREPRTMISSSAPPFPLPVGPQVSATLGLVSEFQHSNQAPTGTSFYSLVASTASPSLSQAPAGQVVRLEPGTRNLILTRPLDKESPEGEQGFVVDVRCIPRLPERDQQRSGSSRTASSGGSLDATTIPVRILVTDANDHAPEFVGPLPYVVNVSETSPIGTLVSRDILALDRDSAGPFSTLHYRVLDDGSEHSALLQFANPLDPALLVAGQLDYETLSSFTLTIEARDQAEPEPLFATAQVQVNVLGK